MQAFLFPLPHVVFFPGTSKPLHVFEPRYLQMVHDAVELHMPIALVKNDGLEEFEPKMGESLPLVHKIAGFGHPTVIEKREDGTLLVFMEAAGKARVGKIVDTSRPYLIVEIENIVEEDEATEQLKGSLEVLRNLLKAWLKRSIDEEYIRNQFWVQIQSDYQLLGNCAAYLIRDIDAQQLILEENSFVRKTELIMSLVSSQELV